MGEEGCPVILPTWRLYSRHQGSFTCCKSTTWDRRLYFPSEGRLAEDFFVLKIPTASAGFEPANLGTKCQHEILGPPKQLCTVGLYGMNRQDEGQRYSEVDVEVKDLF